MAIALPIITLMIGFMTGAVVTAYMYHKQVKEINSMANSLLADMKWFRDMLKAGTPLDINKTIMVMPDGKIEAFGKAISLDVLMKVNSYTELKEWVDDNGK